ncbi:hypothetical protein RUND412_010590 [Rhizina undulata]
MDENFIKTSARFNPSFPRLKADAADQEPPPLSPSPPLPNSSWPPLAAQLPHFPTSNSIESPLPRKDPHPPEPFQTAVMQRKKSKRVFKSSPLSKQITIPSTDTIANETLEAESDTSNAESMDTLSTIRGYEPSEPRRSDLDDGREIRSRSHHRARPQSQSDSPDFIPEQNPKRSDTDRNRSSSSHSSSNMPSHPFPLTVPAQTGIVETGKGETKGPSTTFEEMGIDGSSESSYGFLKSNVSMPTVVPTVAYGSSSTRRKTLPPLETSLGNIVRGSIPKIERLSTTRDTTHGSGSSGFSPRAVLAEPSLPNSQDERESALENSNFTPEIDNYKNTDDDGAADDVPLLSVVPPIEFANPLTVDGPADGIAAVSGPFSSIALSPAAASDPFGFQSASPTSEAQLRAEQVTRRRGKDLFRRGDDNLNPFCRTLTRIFTMSAYEGNWSEDDQRAARKSARSDLGEDPGTRKAAGMTRSWSRPDLIASYIMLV